jgi:hypothetical protein
MAALALAAFPASATADKLVVDDPEAEHVVAAKGVLIYAGQDAQSRDVLIRQRGRKLRRLRVRAAANIKHLDLGTSRSGRTTLVFSRCSKTLDTRSCNVYSYDFRRRRARKVKGAAKRRCGESGPSISRGNVVFLRTGSRRRCKPGVYLKRRGRRARRISRRRGGTTDLSGRRIVFDSSRRGKPTVEVMSLRGRARVLTRFRRAGSGDALLDPTISGRRVYWVERNAISADAEDGPAFRLRRRKIARRRRISSVRLNTTAYTGFTLRRGTVLYSAFSDTDPGGVFSFKPKFR